MAADQQGSLRQRMQRQLRREFARAGRLRWVKGGDAIRCGTTENELLPERLGEHPEEEERTVEIAPPHSARLSNEAVSPFEAGSPDPAGRPPDIPGMEIKCGADADHRRSIQRAGVGGHPDLLLGGAHGDPDDVGLRSVDAPHQRRVFGGGEVSKWGTIKAGNLQAGVEVQQVVPEPLGDPLGAAEEEMPHAVLAPGVANLKEQRRTGHPMAATVPQELGGENDPDPVGQAEPGGANRSAHRLVPMGRHHAVRVGQNDVSLVPPAPPTQDGPKNIGLGQKIESKSGNRALICRGRTAMDDSIHRTARSYAGHFLTPLRINGPQWNPSNCWKNYPPTAMRRTLPLPYAHLPQNVHYSAVIMFLGISGESMLTTGDPKPRTKLRLRP